MGRPAAGERWWVAAGSRGAGMASVALKERGWQWSVAVSTAFSPLQGPQSA